MTYAGRDTTLAPFPRSAFSRPSKVGGSRAYARREWRDYGLVEPGGGRGRATDGRLRAGAEAPRAPAPLLQRTLSPDLGPSVGGATISGYRQEAIKLSICERLPIDVGMPTQDGPENANARVP
jgi:hypothetical protein